jgi:hypothetical protein
MSDVRLIDEERVLEALGTVVLACAGWRGGSLPSQLNESEIDCSSTLHTAATSPSYSILRTSLIQGHSMAEKLASAVRDITASWLQQRDQLVQNPEQQQQQTAGSGSDPVAPGWFHMYSHLCSALSGVMMHFNSLWQQAVNPSGQDSSSCCEQQINASGAQARLG